MIKLIKKAVRSLLDGLRKMGEGFATSGSELNRRK